MVEDGGLFGGGQTPVVIQPVSPGWTPPNTTQFTGLLTESSLSEGGGLAERGGVPTFFLNYC